MWASTCLLSLGLHAKERVRAALLAAGAVWTANEGVARSLVDTADRAEMQRRIDAMTGACSTCVIAADSTLCTLPFMEAAWMPCHAVTSLCYVGLS